MASRNELQREIVDCLDEALRLQSRVIDVTEQVQRAAWDEHGRPEPSGQSDGSLLRVHGPPRSAQSLGKGRDLAGDDRGVTHLLAPAQRDRDRVRHSAWEDGRVAHECGLTVTLMHPHSSRDRVPDQGGRRCPPCPRRSSTCWAFSRRIPLGLSGRRRGSGPTAATALLNADLGRIALLPSSSPPPSSQAASGPSSL